MSSITVDDIAIHVEVSGSGVPVVLLHGWFMNSLSFERQLDGLAGQFQVIVPDLRGHGGTPCPLTGRSFDRPRDVIGVLDGMGIRQAFLGGHSMGGPVAIQTALDYPDRCLGLVLLATGPGPGDRPLKAPPKRGRECEAEAKRLLELGPVAYFHSMDVARAPGVREFLANDSHRRVFDTILERNNPMWLADSLRLGGIDVPPELESHLTSRRRARLSEISVPVLFLVGTMDSTFLPVADLVRREFRYPTVHVLDTASHMLMIDAAEQVNRCIIEFVESHWTSAR
jgi:pimeloyl-ACP methyl ester carboxylesterase